MRKLLILILLVGVFSACKEEKYQITSEEYEILNPFGLEDSVLIKDTYVVFLNMDNYPSILKEYSNNLKVFDEKELDNSVSSKIKSIEVLGEKYGLKLDPDNIFVGAISGFIFQDSSGIVIKEILSDLGKENIEGVQYDYEFYMQNTRARMQNGAFPLLQNVRARMQAEPKWGYDTASFTSKAVLYLGGGNDSDSSEIPNTSKVWVIDSGIDGNHQDLEGLVSVNLSRSFVGDGAPRNDFWGHGTAVSGLIAAIPANKNIPENDSLIGMTGVSPGAELVSLKVFGKSPESKYSWVMKALDHIIKKGGTAGDIVNLSLGNKIRNCRQFGIFKAITDMAEAGFYFSIAAGNAFDQSKPRLASEYLPACIEGERIFTVASIDLDYLTGSIKFSYFSNFGNPPIDMAIPGYYIFTTYPENNKYAVMEGTSMSSGLMAGLLHLTKGNLREKTTVLDSLGISYPVPEK